MILTAERLKELVTYDPETGEFGWKVTQRNARAGKFGCVNGKGYRCARVDGRQHFVHRLAWLYTHGKWPTEQIDHINGIKDDNRLINLRECTAGENQRNTGRQKNNTSGFKGVGWNRQGSNWTSVIKVNHRRIFLGVFSTAEQAYAAYCEAAIKHFGKFARLE
jgi:hypothetical protein